ncbi:hypothetical protein F66182_8530 [Fusarium sp. NRRL 66182]|nr:hypothetical protein F66182_8530 [Fusarium sp. NRRL 66182]
MFMITSANHYVTRIVVKTRAGDRTITTNGTGALSIEKDWDTDKLESAKVIRFYKEMWGVEASDSEDEDEPKGKGKGKGKGKEFLSFISSPISPIFIPNKPSIRLKCLGKLEPGKSCWRASCSSFLLCETCAQSYANDVLVSQVGCGKECPVYYDNIANVYCICDRPARQ